MFLQFTALLAWSYVDQENIYQWWEKYNSTTSSKLETLGKQTDQCAMCSIFCNLFRQFEGQKQIENEKFTLAFLIVRIPWKYSYS